MPDVPDVGLTLSVEPQTTLSRQRSMIGHGIRIHLRAFDRVTGLPVSVGADPSLTIYPPTTAAEPIAVPITLLTAGLTPNGAGIWYADIGGDKAGTWVVYGAMTAPRLAAGKVVFDVTTTGGVVPNAAAPMLATEDPWPIRTEGGNVLTGTRIPALPETTDLAGIVLAGVQGGVSKHITGEMVIAAATGAETEADTQAGADAGPIAGDVAGAFAGAAAGASAGTVVPTGGIATALGYTPANAADVASLQVTTGFAGPLVTVGGFDFALVRYDSTTGRVVSGITIDGETVGVVDGELAVLGSTPAAVIAAPAYTVDMLTPSGTNFLADPDTILMFLVWGQSWAQGGSPDATFTIAALDPGYSLMFDVGAYPGGRAVAGFVDLKEQAYSSSHETICSRAAHAIQAAFQRDLGVKRQILWTVAANGGQPYSALKRGGHTPGGISVYAEALRLVAAATTIAAAQNKKIVVAGIVVVHGEQDFANGVLRWEYARDLAMLRADFNDDIRLITSQTQAVRLITGQVNRGLTTIDDPTIATAQLNVSDFDPLCHCFGPEYYVAADPAQDSTHCLSAGFAMMGEIAGHAIQRLWFGPGWQPTRINDAWYSRTSPTPQITVQYNRPIAIDTSGALIDDSALAAHGLDYHDGATTPPTITAVSVTAPALTAVLGGTGTVTFGPGPGSLGIRSNGDKRKVGARVTVDGISYYFTARNFDVISAVPAAFAAMIPGASAAGAVLTVAGASTLSAETYGDTLVLTLSAAPIGKRQRLFVAAKATGMACGNQQSSRSTIRSYDSWCASATGPALYDWACVEALDLPPI